MDRKEFQELLAEGLKPVLARLDAVEAGSTKANQASEALSKRMTSQETREAARAIVGKSDLPEVSQARVVESIVAAPPLNADGSLNQESFAAAAEAAIKREGEYVAALGGGKVKGMGGAAPAEEAAEADDLATMEAYYTSRGYSAEQAKKMAAMEVN